MPLTCGLANCGLNNLPDQVVRPDGGAVQLGAEQAEEGEEWRAVLALSATSRRSQSGAPFNTSSHWLDRTQPNQ